MKLMKGKSISKQGCSLAPQICSRDKLCLDKEIIIAHFPSNNVIYHVPIIDWSNPEKYGSHPEKYGKHWENIGFSIAMLVYWNVPHTVSDSCLGYLLRLDTPTDWQIVNSCSVERLVETPWSVVSPNDDDIFHAVLFQGRFQKFHEPWHPKLERGYISSQINSSAALEDDINQLLGVLYSFKKLCPVLWML